MNCKGVIDLAAKIRNQGLKVPIVLFTYYNPIYKYGIQKFTQDAAE
ncbi:MAG: tryptophan synthase subunit alpha, partial [Zetaproteobacteria bacterium]|nr:tryptophan synthase subunit alpha [Pseudobdellovibrionaceae bacterium]